MAKNVATNSAQSQSGGFRAPRRYIVDLSGQQACCEANYARLLKLMPTFDQRDQWHYDVQAGEQFWSIRLAVTERARYTTMLEVTQQNGLQEWGSSPRLQVRLYHDARMAEVVAWQEHRRVRPRYEYPNRNMYQRDEKAQFNRFLEDWLSHSLAHGQSCQTVDL
ncbi:DUF1249 domain-containing protein [Aestuariicella hydrocarbonica]|uniref:DUF1249 domain-containing protein n=1 Tax=Pseudomaricurvus hydrocarbonicus TaxID=1470433 RepID=A0A9E5JTF6_9GAMM|nr:DUF1249 domain-containing protein [Aestuariicella hydrocarbonica]NHO66522.1 DUF1249 domain-containing protein [Aestuariicella hydrocarbonica]